MQEVDNDSHVGYAKGGDMHNKPTPREHASDAKDHGGVFNARIEGLQRKWSDICHRLHHNLPSQQNRLVIRPTFPFPHHCQPNTNISEISSKDSNQENQCRNPSPPVDLFATSSSPPTSITTDLGLGTIYVSPDRDPKQREVDEMSKHASNEIAKSSEKDYKQLYKALGEKVGYQNDAISAISQTISRIRTAYGRRHVWLMFSGSDIVGKKKLTTALADVIFGSRESLISIDLNFENQICHKGSIFDRQGVNFSDPSFRGKTITSYIAEELTKRPRTVVFLEHIDKADFLTKDNLSQAIKSGKLSDARGREIRVTDAIFVTTTSKEADEDDLLTYSEERVLNTKASQLRISIERAEPGNSSILLLPKESVSRNPEMSNKRKFTEIGEFEILVPKVKKIKSCFDLNLPLEEAEESESDTDSDTKDVWLEEFLEQMDEKVVFEPFDFDSRSETILNEITKCFKKSFGTNVILEIENEVMLQILASCWLSDRAGGVEKWIDGVLYRGLMEAREKQGGVSGTMVKLAAVQGVTIEDDALCSCLPSRIIVG
ncbi:protein SMAX1-LIKE 6 [Tanacetum coccineum]|uniref:Protein SMAX1-LIKE 6 n=1 Tax=Tanacetum coccineum TaxID=301880 RepID=A0ABQ4ZFT8_9ASTR